MFILIKFFADRWLGPRIELQVTHQYNERLEDHKAELELQLKRAIMEMEASYRDAVDQKEADKALFRTFLDHLKSDTKLEFLKNHVPPNPIPNKLFSMFDEFLAKWTDAEYSFLDEDIEAKRKAILLYISEYLDYVAHNTWRLKDNPHYNSVPAEWEDSQPERYVKTTDTMQQLADEAVKSYGEMIRVGKAKLNL